MYRVVGCRDCGALWIVADQPETTSCPRCGTRHRFERLHAFAETDDEAVARQARATLLAERAGESLDELDDLTGSQLDAAVPAEAYLEESGLDHEVVEAAGEQAASGPARSRSRRETVLEAFDALDRPTEAEVVAYAADRGVPAGAVSGLLDRLVRAGEVSESGGHYRRL